MGKASRTKWERRELWPQERKEAFWRTSATYRAMLERARQREANGGPTDMEKWIGDMVERHVATMQRNADLICAKLDDGSMFANSADEPLR